MDEAKLRTAYEQYNRSSPGDLSLEQFREYALALELHELKQLLEEDEVSNLAPIVQEVTEEPAHSEEVEATTSKKRKRDTKVGGVATPDPTGYGLKVNQNETSAMKAKKEQRTEPKNPRRIQRSSTEPTSPKKRGDVAWAADTAQRKRGEPATQGSRPLGVESDVIDRGFENPAKRGKAIPLGGFVSEGKHKTFGGTQPSGSISEGVRETTNGISLTSRKQRVELAAEDVSQAQTSDTHLHDATEKPVKKVKLERCSENEALPGSRKHDTRPANHAKHSSKRKKSENVNGNLYPSQEAEGMLRISSGSSMERPQLLEQDCELWARGLDKEMKERDCIEWAKQMGYLDSQFMLEQAGEKHKLGGPHRSVKSAKNRRIRATNVADQKNPLQFFGDKDRGPHIILLKGLRSGTSTADVTAGLPGFREAVMDINLQSFEDSVDAEILVKKTRTANSILKALNNGPSQDRRTCLHVKTALAKHTMTVEPVAFIDPHRSSTRPSQAEAQFRALTSSGSSALSGSSASPLVQVQGTYISTRETTPLTGLLMTENRSGDNGEQVGDGPGAAFYVGKPEGSIADVRNALGQGQSNRQVGFLPPMLNTSPPGLRARRRRSDANAHSPIRSRKPLKLRTSKQESSVAIALPLSDGQGFLGGDNSPATEMVEDVATAFIEQLCNDMSFATVPGDSLAVSTDVRREATKEADSGLGEYRRLDDTVLDTTLQDTPDFQEPNDLPEQAGNEGRSTTRTRTRAATRDSNGDHIDQKTSNTPHLDSVHGSNARRSDSSSSLSSLRSDDSRIGEYPASTASEAIQDERTESVSSTPGTHDDEEEYVQAHSDQTEEDFMFDRAASRRSTKQQPAKRTGLRSTHFATPTQPSPTKTSRAPAGTLSCIPFPPITNVRFGLTQEKLAHDPFRLLVAVQFLNKTKGSVAMPVFYKLIERYPTPETLAEADQAEVSQMIQHLGLQNTRAKKIIALAKTWIVNPPGKGRRYRSQNYPFRGAHKDIKKGDVLDDLDDREGAFEVSHLPGVGPYATDSWRMFCRDKLRGLAKDWDGQGAVGDDFDPEWTRVLPTDKELRAFLRWMWLKRGVVWDPLTGEKRDASEEVMVEARKGSLMWQERKTLNSEGEKVVEEELVKTDNARKEGNSSIAKSVTKRRRKSRPAGRAE